MDEIIDRVIQILKDELPESLANINRHYSASDIANFGVALTLAAPVEYLYGKNFIFSGMPSVQVFSDTISPNKYGEGHGAIDNHSVFIELYWRADFREVVNRQIRRYKWAVYNVCRKYRMRKLQNASGKDDYSQEGLVTGITSEHAITYTGDVLYNTLRVAMDFRITTAIIDELIEINYS